MRLRVVLCASLGIVLSHAVSAQTALATLPRGSRVRLLAPAAGVIWPARAVLDSSSAESLFVSKLSEPPAMRGLSRIAIPVASIRKLEVPVEGASRWPHARQGALWGLGAYLVFVATYVVHEKSTCQSDCFGDGEAFIVLAAGVPWATAAGAVVGAALPIRNWRVVDLPR
jgi:hypothetical protein